MDRFLYLILLVVVAAKPVVAGQIEPLIIHTRDAQRHAFTVEIADTPETRARGLMFREKLPEKHGMIFIFKAVRKRNFWMKNTYIPLDILFIDEQAKIISIKQGEPESLENIPSEKPAQAAIEFARGTVEAYNIQIGDKIEHPSLLFP